MIRLIYLQSDFILLILATNEYLEYNHTIVDTYAEKICFTANS